MNSRNSAQAGVELVRRYWCETSRPLVNLAFVAPLLVAYEGGLFWLGPQAMRNGADVWLRQLLELIGFSQYFLLPAITCGLLLAWHHLNRDRWQVCSGVLYGMLLESLAFGAVLLLVAHLNRSLLSVLSPCAIDLNTAAWGRAVSYLGAGIYEELLFRGIMLPFLALGLRGLGLSHRWSIGAAVILSSLIFAAAHYSFDFSGPPAQWVMSVKDSLVWSTFLFRTVAGAFFCILFLARGFGIAVGAHALYDILVACF